MSGLQHPEQDADQNDQQDHDDDVHATRLPVPLFDPDPRPEHTVCQGCGETLNRYGRCTHLHLHANETDGRLAAADEYHLWRTR